MAKSRKTETAPVRATSVLRVPAPAVARPSAALLAAICVGLVAMTAAIYWPVYNYEYQVYDDDSYINQNLMVQRGLTWETVKWAFTAVEVANWHPLTWLSHLLDFELFKLNPGPQHVVNVLFHLVNTVLLFWALYWLTGGTDGSRRKDVLWPSAFVAAVFGVHPAHVESVAWIAERKDVLSTLFWTLALMGYAAYAKRPGLKRYLLVFFPFVLVPFALGLMAKPMLVTFPFVLLLLDCWPLGRIADCGLRIADSKLQNPKTQAILDRRSFHNPQSAIRNLQSLVAEKVPMFVLTAISSWITFLMQKKGGAVQSLDQAPLGPRLVNTTVSYARYVGKMIWPSDLAPFYPGANYYLPWWQIAGAVLMLIMITALALWARKRCPYLSVGWFWFLGTLVPVIGIVQVGAQSIADRYTYVPFVGLSIMAAWGLRDCGLWIADCGLQTTESQDASDSRSRSFLQSAIRNLQSAISIAILAVFIVAASIQVRYWHDSEKLFRHAVEVTSENEVCPFNLGIALKRLKRIDEAEKYFIEALRIRPNHVNSNIYMGLINYERGNFDKAVEYYKKALDAAPSPNHADAENNLAVALQAQGKVEESAVHYARAIELNPGYPDARYNYGTILLQLNRRDEGIAQFRAALALNPNHSYARDALEGALRQAAAAPPSAASEAPLPTNRTPATADECCQLGNVLVGQKRYREAGEQFEKALKLSPGLIGAWINLGNCLAAQQRLRDAAATFRDVLKTYPDNADTYINLGNVLMELNELDDALEQYKKGLDLDPRSDNAWCSYGYVFAKKGKFKEAAEACKKALAINPKNAGAQQILDQVNKELDQ